MYNSWNIALWLALRLPSSYRYHTRSVSYIEYAKNKWLKTLKTPLKNHNFECFRHTVEVRRQMYISKNTLYPKYLFQIYVISPWKEYQSFNIFKESVLLIICHRLLEAFGKHRKLFKRFMFNETKYRIVYKNLPC